MLHLSKSLQQEQSPLMGLSEVSILQRESKVLTKTGTVILKKVGRSIVCYKPQHAKKAKEDISEKQLEALRGERFKGDMTPQTRRRMFQIIENWQQTLTFQNSEDNRFGLSRDKQIILITLTLAQTQSMPDKDIKRKMLAPFLKYILEKEPSTRYLWKAEPQVNGNIHFHILVDNYFDKDLIRRLWNQIQYNCNVHNYEDYTDSKLGAPSTRIESLRDKNDAFAYMAKYLSKSSGGRLIQGRVWGCCDALRDLQNITVTITTDEARAVINEAISGNSSIYEDEFCLIVKRTNFNYSMITDPQALDELYAKNTANLILLNKHVLTMYKRMSKRETLYMVLDTLF